MNEKEVSEVQIIKKLKHYLPAQAPLKDFITQNRLISFQDHKFHDALQMSSEIFGYDVYSSIKEYRNLYQSKKLKTTTIFQ